MPRLIAMAGLPGTGKSTLARRLATELPAVVLDKDAVRAALFPPPALDYSAEQDEIAMAAIYRAAAHILSAIPSLSVILDGRTFRRRNQVESVLAVAAEVGTVPEFIECVAADDVVRSRLDADRAVGRHPAGNRTFELYLALKAEAEPLTVPHLTLDTAALSLDACVAASLQYLQSG